MTKFIYISDTHQGAAPMGFQQQRGYPESISTVTAALSSYIDACGDIDFVLHGGDMVDSTSPVNLSSARNYFALPVPVYLCLGNHDLTTPDALDAWLSTAPQFFVRSNPNYTIEREDCLIHVMPNHWQDEPFYWKRDQRAHFKADQLEWIDHQLDLKTDLPHILVTHSPTKAVPSDQTGIDKPFHDPGTDFTESILSIIKGKNHVKCVLGGHSHINTCVMENDVAFITASALIETPFEFKTFEISGQKIEMRTVPLGPLPELELEYDNTRTYVQGRPQDRELTLQLEFIR